ncbi:metallophosphoesterase family protein [Ancylobacter lacus]|uniref:metallophosphoesterase family protein n=1 Tax=Ancylobacter lacus TaxID=2579970 RepID=UPI001BD0FA0A|nr:DNA repair exonuclease [Ancylobacter lacus]MBS7538854.1 DNA repair exonuclease [Ancylobacter lacus]
MAFRFVHTADLHLDSPLRSLALRNPDLAALVGDASRRALVAIIDLCLDEQVDALVIAGDLYDGDQTSMKTARFLASQMERLHAAGIDVFKVRGNHDAMSRITQELILPPSVKVFGGRAEAVELKRGGLDIVVHGLSFARPHAPESLLPKFRRPVGDAVNIGIMHTSLAGSAGHDLYAPCSVAELQGWGFDYWALGHIHARSQHEGAGTVVMPGIPQGRDINEAGPKTVSLVTLHDDRRLTVEQRLVSLAQFERVAVDLGGVASWSEAIGLIERALATQREHTASDHLVARLSLTGATPLAWRLRRDRDLLLAETEQRAQRLGRTWIDRIELATEAPSVATAAGTADPLVELRALMQSDIVGRHAIRQSIRELAEAVRDDLPPDARGFGGEDETGFEAFLTQLLEEGSEEVMARLAPATGDE